MQKTNIISLVRNFLCRCSKAQTTRIWFCLNLEIFCPFSKKSASTRCVLWIGFVRQHATVTCTIFDGSMRIYWYPTPWRNLFQQPLFYPSIREHQDGETSSNWRAFLLRCVSGNRFHRIRVDSRPNRRKKSLFSNKNSKPCICLFACYFAFIFCLWLLWLISESQERALCFSNLLLLPELIFQ